MGKGTYVFQHTDVPSYLLLDSIGWQSTASPAYGHDGLSRLNSGYVVFQLTLRGEGRIEQGGTEHRLTPGKGSAIHVPDHHRFSYDEACSTWEYIWLNASGEDAIQMWERIQARWRPLFTLAEASPVLDRFWELYRSVSEEQLRKSLPSCRRDCIVLSWPCSRRKHLRTEVLQPSKNWLLS